MKKIYQKVYEGVFDNLYDGIYFVDKNKKITYWNKGMGKLTDFKSAQMIGKFCEKSVFIHISNNGKRLCGKQCPLSRTIADGRSRKTEVYIKHKDGHLLPVSMHIAPIKNLRRQIIGGVLIHTDISAKFAMNQRLEECRKMALLDSLTKVANRRYIEMNLGAKLDEMKRYKWPFGILFIDLDRFKNINDVHGHSIGDRVLKMVAATLVNNLRPFDILGRWGGEEFIGIITNVDEHKLYSIAERLRLLVEQSSFSVGLNIVSVTVSIGATIAQSSDTVDMLVKRADKLMYLGKGAGRNRVSIKL